MASASLFSADTLTRIPGYREMPASQTALKAMCSQTLEQKTEHIGYITRKDTRAKFHEAWDNLASTLVRPEVTLRIRPGLGGRKQSRRPAFLPKARVRRDGKWDGKSFNRPD
jgi:hypothetical protein